MNQWTDQAKAKLRSYPALRGKVVQAKDAVFQVKLAAAAARNAPIVVEDEFGIKLLVPPFMRGSARSLVQRHSDRAAFKLMATLLRPGDVVYDVGANIGLYSVHAARQVGPKGRVFAFEAVPTTADRLDETLALNHTREVTVVRAAVSDTSGTISMNVFADPEASGWNSLGTHAMHTYDGKAIRPDHTVEVTAETLDAFSEREGIDSIAFCKVDVEGFERHVFSGAASLLSEGRIGVLTFEISEDPLVGEGGVASEVFEALTRHDYKVMRHDEATDTVVGPIDPREEEKRLNDESLRPYVANYFAARDPRVLR
ncbi:FkbM family methyltransferase [Frankia nepalensis]|uniref:FkbM family methyltransferase n=1 Tax=Frankia nepalensis TaxID=1836974 RepID=A0A937RK74_9ACTN|nr:FkbM family methyltransferase [Frankia nepalensis]MBL7502256.1 FkbM family methyltransferase [Frankia nepalensis]MBL7516411.1 FkbM family methyltransferase [Frankia nepalensis]MBL7631820.1 FkbM family methyltransferase [Frankia nepalensis]